MAKRTSLAELENWTISSALSILERRSKKKRVELDATTAKDFLRLQARGLEQEVFAVMFLDTHHRLIAYKRLFQGTLNWTVVHPRVVAKRALINNAAFVVLHHNHPSGSCRPSLRDHELTNALKSALELIEVRVLDHIITCDSAAASILQ